MPRTVTLVVMLEVEDHARPLVGDTAIAKAVVHAIQYTMTHDVAGSEILNPGIVGQISVNAIKAVQI